MEERREPSTARPRGRGTAGHLDEVRHERGVRQLDELRQPGRAARREHDRDIALVGPRRGRWAAAAVSAANDGSPSTITSSTPACAAASRAAAASGPTVITLRARVRRNCAASSPLVKSGLAGDTRRRPAAAVEDRRRTPGCSAGAARARRRDRSRGRRARRRPARPAGELAVGEHPPARAVDQRRRVGEAAGVAEHERRQVGARDLGIGQGLRSTVCSSSVDMVDLLRCS